MQKIGLLTLNDCRKLSADINPILIVEKDLHEKCIYERSENPELFDYIMVINEFVLVVIEII